MEAFLFYMEIKGVVRRAIFDRSPNDGFDFLI